MRGFRLRLLAGRGGGRGGLAAVVRPGLADVDPRGGGGHRDRQRGAAVDQAAVGGELVDGLAGRGGQPERGSAADQGERGGGTDRRVPAVPGQRREPLADPGGLAVWARLVLAMTAPEPRSHGPPPQLTVTGQGQRSKPG